MCKDVARKKRNIEGEKKKYHDESSQIKTNPRTKD